MYLSESQLSTIHMDLSVHTVWTAVGLSKEDGAPAFSDAVENKFQYFIESKQ